jgi:hypothetical protein
MTEQEFMSLVGFSIPQGSEICHPDCAGLMVLAFALAQLSPASATCKVDVDYVALHDLHKAHLMLDHMH